MVETDELPPMMDGKTDWSMDFATLQRINLILYTCRDARKTMDVIAWYHELVSLYLETLPELKKRDKQGNIENMRVKIDKLYLQWENRYNNYMALSNIDKKKFAFVFDRNTLVQFEKFEKALRIILDKAGMLMKRSEGGHVI